MTLSNYTIRTAEASDRDAVATLIRDSTNAYYQERLGAGPIFPPTEMYTRDIVDLYRQLEGSESLLCVDEHGTIAGSCFVHRRETHFSLGIMNVASGHFGQGIAKKLLTEIIFQAEAAGQPLRLVSSCLNLDSYSLYTRAGLKPFEFYQGIMIAVPEDGFPKQSTDGLVRSGTVEDIEATAKLEGAPAELMSPTVAPEQLFDTANDPHEINNLAESNDPQHREALIGMRAALAVWEVEMQDQGVFLEPAAIVAPFEKEMHDWFGTPKWHPYKGK